MTQNALHFIGKIGLLAAMVVLAMSCTVPGQRQDEPGQSRQADRIPLVRKLTQLDFGGKASYAACMEPACPAVTRKTLAVPATTTPATAAMPQTTEASAADRPALRLATELQTLPSPKRIIVRFASGSANLSPPEKIRLDRAMAEAPETGEVVITGYTDSTGSRRANQRLAQARAQAVHDHLRARLSAHQTTLGLGKQAPCCFLAANDTTQGRQQNRRVEVVLRAPGQAPP